MEELNSSQKACLREAVMVSLREVKSFVSSSDALSRFSTEESKTPEQTRAEMQSKIDAALAALDVMQPETFDMEAMFAAGHNEVLLQCLEFYGEYIQSMLGFIALGYRLAYTKKNGITPEQVIEMMKAQQQQEAGVVESSSQVPSDVKE